MTHKKYYWCPVNIDDVNGSKNRFQYERPCKNLGEVRSLVTKQNANVPRRGTL